ncbi:hypothetical protein E4U10_006720 [Claviceps purpurea]|nr:hypothetical protein E4U10_006720 [Claviceps purpurea]
MRQEVGAMRQEMAFKLNQVHVSVSGLDKRLLAVESSLMVHINARLDTLLDGVFMTHLDIQGLALDFDQAHDRVFTSMNHVHGAVFDVLHESRKKTRQEIRGLSQTLMDHNERAGDSFLEIGRGIDGNRTVVLEKLDTLHRDMSSTICKKIDNANGNISQTITDSRDHVCDQISQVQQEVESSRRRINEKINSMHEAIATLLHTTRDRVTHKVDRIAVLLGSNLFALRDHRKSRTSAASKHVEPPGKEPLFQICPSVLRKSRMKSFAYHVYFANLVCDAEKDPHHGMERELLSKKKTRLESILKIPKY